MLHFRAQVVTPLLHGHFFTLKLTPTSWRRLGSFDGAALGCGYLNLELWQCPQGLNCYSIRSLPDSSDCIRSPCSLRDEAKRNAVQLSMNVQCCTVHGTALPNPESLQKSTFWRYEVLCQSPRPYGSGANNARIGILSLYVGLEPFLGVCCASPRIASRPLLLLGNLNVSQGPYTRLFLIRCFQCTSCRTCKCTAFAATVYSAFRNHSAASLRCTSQLEIIAQPKRVSSSLDIRLVGQVVHHDPTR